MKEIDLTIERRQYFNDDFDGEACPECGAVLTKKDCSILICAKSQTDEAEFMTNLSGSTFCHNCPIVVFDKKLVEKAAQLGIRAKDEIHYSIMGIINLDAVPKEKAQVQRGTDKNPLPLVSFLPSKYTQAINIPNPPTRAGKKVGRNEPCPCGSGKKYKKCCGF